MTKFILHCSIAALLGTLLAMAWAQSPTSTPLDGKRPRIEVEGGVSGVWFTIERINKTDPNGKGFDPSFCYMLSNYKPLIKKLKNGKYLIQFTSEIAEDLP